MNDKTFKALVVTETEDKSYKQEISDRVIADLPDGEVLVRVHYSSLNYKDALSATGNKGVTRKYPHTPGIDAAGVVEECSNDQFKSGDQVIVTSYDLGMNTSGGFADYIRIPADWVVPCPEGLGLKDAMIYGTAGYTAGLCIEALLRSVKPEDGEILVTGASGGVGSIAVAILVKLGFEVVAVTGKTSEKDFFEKLGVKEVISREDASDSSGRPVLKSRWAGVVDTVGGEILATAVKTANYNAAVTCCGMVASPDLPLNVFPFILRNVQLLGIDSQNTPMALRKTIWDKLASEWKLEHLDSLTQEIGMEQLPEYIQQILKGQIKGRTVVKLV